MWFVDFLFSALAAILFSGVEPLLPSWNFSSFQSRSHPVATEQVLAQSDQRFGKRCRKLIFKMAAVATILDFLSARLATQLAFYVNLHRAVIGPSATLTGR